MLNKEGVALLRALIFKAWSLNQAREAGDCSAIAEELSTWLPPDMTIEAADVYAALGRDRESKATLNSAILRDKIDALPVLYSARLNGDYQAILNEVRKDTVCSDATLADVVDAMAFRAVMQPANIARGRASLVGISFVR